MRYSNKRNSENIHHYEYICIIYDVLTDITQNNPMQKKKEISHLQLYSKENSVCPTKLLPVDKLIAGICLFVSIIV